jgi:hypothetical protein
VISKKKKAWKIKYHFSAIAARGSNRWHGGLCDPHAQMCGIKHAVRNIHELFQLIFREKPHGYCVDTLG